MPGDIDGTVTNSQTDDGVPETTVTCTCATGSTTTDTNGDYSFADVAPGTYSMTFTATGFAPATVNDVVVAPAGDTMENETLAPGGRSTATSSTTRRAMRRSLARP